MVRLCLLFAAENVICWKCDFLIIFLIDITLRGKADFESVV